jgi:hypothetical protein
VSADDPIDTYGPRPDDGDRSYDHWLSEAQPWGRGDEPPPAPSPDPAQEG